LKKLTNEMSRKLSKEEAQMVDKYMKKYSMSLMEMQVKRTLGFHLTPVKMAVINNTNDNKCW
jgi:hypothetical protein